MPHINLTWWNLQNFFDTDDDPISLDFEYTPAHGWTQERFEQKRDNLARALAATHGGEGPHLLAVAEIEKDGLLEQVIAAMGNSRLKVAVDRTGTRDLRGIDVAVAYDRDLFELVEQRSHVVHLRYRTRDIFELVLRLKATGELLVVIAGHWPSRKRGQFETEPLRCAVAENIAFLVESHAKVSAEDYELLRAQDNLRALREKWQTKLLVVGDFNDQPFDRSLVEHLKASKDLGFVTGTRNDIGAFSKEVADYRERDVFLYNPTARLAAQAELGSYYFAGEDSVTTNPYQILDQLVVSRGLLSDEGLRLVADSVSLFRDKLVATPSGRPRAFDKGRGTGTSDHLPLLARLAY